MTTELHERGARLIQEAFTLARDAGAPGWETMTTAVLKNRMLDLTDRTFKEADWGAASFRDFVLQFDDVLEDVSGSWPPEVRLRQGVALPPLQPADPGMDVGANRFIRRDLWKAALDYSSGNRYYWDGQRAVPSEGEVTSEAKVLPTVTEEELKVWRVEFVQEQSTENTERASLLYGWLERTEPLSQLPTSLRVPWVIELKSRVLTRLKDWFDAEGIPVPADIVTRGEGRRESDIDALREGVLAAVRSMSRSELEALQLPATVLLRHRG